MNAALQNFKRPGVFLLYIALLIISVYMGIAAGSAVDESMKPANPSPILFAGTQLVAVFAVIVSAIKIAGFGFVLMAGQTKIWEMIQQISNAVVECLILLVIVACTIVLSFLGRHPHRALSWLALLGAWFVLWVGAGLLISLLLQAIANTNAGYSWFRRRAARPCYIMLYGSRKLEHVQNTEGEDLRPDPATDTATTLALKEPENTRPQK
jgi:magnesium-transporting ATPase (P-type)